MGEAGLPKEPPKPPPPAPPAVSDFDAANPRDIVARVEGEPFLAEIDFAIGVKIHGRAGIKESNVRQMSRHIAGRQIKRPAKRDDRVGEITADAVASFDDLRRGEVGSSGQIAVFNICLHPVALGLHSREGIDDLTTMFSGYMLRI